MGDLLDRAIRELLETNELNDISRRAEQRRILRDLVLKSEAATLSRIGLHEALIKATEEPDPVGFKAAWLAKYRVEQEFKAGNSALLDGDL